MATEIKNEDHSVSWLGLPVADARVIACRSALRVLPLIAGISRGEQFAELTFTVFRENALAWAAAKFPGRVHDLFHVSISVRASVYTTDAAADV